MIAAQPGGGALDAILALMAHHVTELTAAIADAPAAQSRDMQRVVVSCRASETGRPQPLATSYSLQPPPQPFRHTLTPLPSCRLSPCRLDEPFTEPLSPATPRESRGVQVEDGLANFADADCISDAGCDAESVETGGEILIMRSAWQVVDDGVVQHYLTALQERNTQIARQTSPRFLRRARTVASTSTLELGDVCCREVFSWVIHPVSGQRLLWDVLSLFALAYDIFMIPMNVFEISQDRALLALQWICAVFWLLDMVMSCRTSVLDGPMLQTSARFIASRYARTWMPFDLLIVLADWVVLNGGSGDALYAIRVLRVFRLVRIAKLMTLARAFEQRIYSNQAHLCLSLFRIFVEFSVAMHLITCAWFWLGDNVSGGWTSEEHMGGTTVFYKYFYASRWTIAQISGRTDVVIRTAPEYTFTCFVCVFGFCALSLIISSITNTMIELSALHRERTEQLGLLLGYLQRHRLSAALSMRMKMHFNAQLKERGDSPNDEPMLQLLPKQILMDVFHEIRGPVVTSHPFFADLSFEFSRVLFRLCSEAVQPFSIQNNEVLFMAGDACSRMLFVELGFLHYVPSSADQKSKYAEGKSESAVVSFDTAEEVVSDDSPAKKAEILGRTLAVEGVLKPDGQPIGPRMWLSEAALWVQWENRGKLTASSRGTLFALEASDFIAAVRLFRDAFVRTSLYARAFAEQLQHPNEPLDDVSRPIAAYIPDVVPTMESSRSDKSSKSGRSTPQGRRRCEPELVPGTLSAEIEKL